MTPRRSKPDQNKLKSGFHSRGVLPHLKREGATYFVAFRLVGTLPQDVLLRLKAGREVVKNMSRIAQPVQKQNGLSLPAPIQIVELDAVGRDEFGFMRRLICPVALRRPSQRKRHRQQNPQKGRMWWSHAEGRDA